MRKILLIVLITIFHANFSFAQKLTDQSTVINENYNFYSIGDGVSFNFEEENEAIDLFVESRDFDSQYPHLIREIPESIIQAKEKQ